MLEAGVGAAAFGLGLPWALLGRFEPRLAVATRACRGVGENSHQDKDDEDEDDDARAASPEGENEDDGVRAALGLTAGPDANS